MRIINIDGKNYKVGLSSSGYPLAENEIYFNNGLMDLHTLINCFKINFEIKSENISM